ncbi:MAG: hypothetical protein L0Y42_07935 [Phycisphaerales bacterium]|nr:hypothetical protein [Phycisphaerales bacterium]
MADPAGGDDEAADRCWNPDPGIPDIEDWQMESPAIGGFPENVLTDALVR